MSDGGISKLRASLDAAGVVVLHDDGEVLAPAREWRIAPADWPDAASAAARLGLRFAGLWGDQLQDEFVVRAVLQLGGDYLVIATVLPQAQPQLASIAASFPGAARLERHMRDLLGIDPVGAGDPRRWTRHQAWQVQDYPLRRDGAAAGRPGRRTPSDTDYPFEPIRGKGVFEIAVGPVHAGIIEPGHFRFQAAGEDVLRLEARLGYVHKGIEAIAVGRDPGAAARLAGRISGDSTVAHTWAACQAMERAADCRVPDRALALRAVLCERERVANHLGDIGAICNDVGFSFAHMQCARLRELWQRRSAAVFGHRLLMDTVVPGGVSGDLSGDQAASLAADNHTLRSAVAPLFDVIVDHPSLDDRLIGTGVLRAADAAMLGCTGYVGKASGQTFDVRKDAPYPPYDTLELAVAGCADGDVAARVRVRIDEIEASLSLLDQLLGGLPGGAVRARWQDPVAGAVGLGVVEGWRGEIVCFVRFDDRGRVARLFPRDPSWFLWPALERLIHGNIVPDFPVCNKSVNASYSGQDL